MFSAWQIYTQYVSKHDGMVDTLLRAEAGGGGNGSGSSGKKTSEGFRKWLEVGMGIPYGSTGPRLLYAEA